MRVSPRSSATVWLAAIVCVLLCAPGLPGTAGAGPARPTAANGEGSGLRIVGPNGETTPVVNERGKIALSVVDEANRPVAVDSWSSDSPKIAKIGRKKGKLKGVTYGFATITATVAGERVSTAVVVARVRTQNGGIARGDTKTDRNGNVYISSPSDQVIYRVSGLSDAIFAGRLREAGYAEGRGTEARFDGPTGLSVDNRQGGGVYVADTNNHCVRKVGFGGATRLVLGDPYADGVLDGDVTALEHARVGQPVGIAAVGESFYFTDARSHALYVVDAVERNVYLIAGTPAADGFTDGRGRAARFSRPTGLAINSEQDLLAVADTDNDAVRLVRLSVLEDGRPIGDVSTLGRATNLRRDDTLTRRGAPDDRIAFVGPKSVSIDSLSNVYVVDEAGASVATRLPDGRYDQVQLAQAGTLGTPASVVIQGTRAFVLDEATADAARAVKVVEVGPPRIASVDPSRSPLDGGVEIVIEGENFAPESVLVLGDAVVLDYTVESARRIRAVVPAQEFSGARTLTVRTRGGTAQTSFDILPADPATLRPGEATVLAGSSVPPIGDGGLATDPSVRVFASASAISASGDLYFADFLHDRIRRLDAETGIITTVAGTGIVGAGPPGDDALATALNGPYGLAVDGSGDLLVADSGNDRILKVESVTGLVLLFAGNGEVDGSGDGGPATDASLRNPTGIFVDARGDVIIADYGNNRIRRVDARTGIIETIAGRGELGFAGDGGPAIDALFYGPGSLALGSNGDLYVCDIGNRRIRRISAETGLIDTVAGNGSQADIDGVPALETGFFDLQGLAIAQDGDIWIADGTRPGLRRIDHRTNIIDSVAPTESEDIFVAPEVPFRSPLATSVLVDGLGNVVYTEWKSGRVRRFGPSDESAVTIAGTDTPGVLGDGGLATSARFAEPVAVAGFENFVAIADARARAVREVDLRTNIISTVIAPGSSPLVGDDFIPNGVVYDDRGNLYVSDTNGGEYRVLHRNARTGRVRVLVSSSDSNLLRSPRGLAFDSLSQSLIVAATGSQRVLRVGPLSNPKMEVVAGNGEFGTSGDFGPALEASLADPNQVAVSPTGVVFISDRNYEGIRRVDADGIIRPVSSPIVGIRRDPRIACAGSDTLFVAGNDWRHVRRAALSGGESSLILGSGMQPPERGLPGSECEIDLVFSLAYVEDSLYGPILLVLDHRVLLVRGPF